MHRVPPGLRKKWTILFMDDAATTFTPGYVRYALALLVLTNVLNYMDRMILSVVLEEIKAEFALSDTQSGILAGFSFAIFYGTVGILIAQLADRYSRRRIIALSMLAWSAVTALTGATQNFWQLFLARVGIGVGEAGVIPSATSLVADYFVPAHRSVALAVLSTGATLGVVAGLGLGGWMADLYGWRWAFVIAGIPGVPISLLVWRTLRDPPRGLSDGRVQTNDAAPSFIASMRILLARKAYVHVVIGGCFANFVLLGILPWLPAFMIRKFNIDTSQAGFFFGTAIGLGAALGAVLGGIAANRLVKRNIDWLVRIPLLTSFLYLPLYELAIFSNDVAVAFVLIFIINVVGGVSFGPMVAAMQSVVPPATRATAAALYGFSVCLISTGGAPFLVGVLSDAFASVEAHGSLQLALAIAVLLSAAAPFHYARALRWFRRDMADLDGTSNIGTRGQREIVAS